MLVQLENDLACKLQDTGREGGPGSNDTKAAGTEVALREGVVGLVEDVEGLEAEVEHGAFVKEWEALMQTEVGLMEGIEANRVPAPIAVGLINGGQAEQGWIQSLQILVSAHLDSLAFRQDRIAGGLG